MTNIKRRRSRGVPIVILAGRILRDKGVGEFVSAARLLREAGIASRFQIAGAIDPGNPSSYTEAEIAAWEENGLIELLGFRSDLSRLFASANLVVLPSYREGLPKVLIEAAACARAVVTTNVPGCRDAIEPDKTGVLVPARDGQSLAQAIRFLIEHPVIRKNMGSAGRSQAEKLFSIENVISKHLEIYDGLMVGG
ncbi:glycosyltransferase [Devosia sp. A8/3-2]|nr:glycosyltransferase [Devosia sp. A8/3-2]